VEVAVTNRRRVQQAATAAAARRPMCFWTKLDVQRWLQRHVPSLYVKYAAMFADNDICGRVLVELSDAGLLEMGVADAAERSLLMHNIHKSRLRSDYDELNNRI